MDNGNTWVDSNLLSDEIQTNTEVEHINKYGWFRFCATIKIPAQISELKDFNMTIMCRATDNNGIMQPQVSKKERGYLYNGWHKVHIKII